RTERVVVRRWSVISVSTSSRTVRGCRADEGVRVRAHDPPNDRRVELLHVLEVLERLGEALGVGGVGAAQEPLGLHAGPELRGRRLPERAHPDVAPEDLDRVLVELLRDLAVDVCQAVEERTDPIAAVLDRGDLEAGEAREGPVADEAPDQVVDVAMTG